MSLKETNKSEIETIITAINKAREKVNHSIWSDSATEHQNAQEGLLSELEDAVLFLLKQKLKGPSRHWPYILVDDMPEKKDK